MIGECCELHSLTDLPKPSINSPVVYLANPASYCNPLSQPLPHGFVDNLGFFHMWKVPRIFDDY